MAISDKVLQEKIDHLSKDITPERDLWAGVEKAISQQQNIIAEKSHVPRMPLAWAASIVAAVLLTWYGTGNMQSIQSPELTIAAQMNLGFNQEKQLMLASFGSPSIETLSPEMQTQLAQLEKARHAIENALNDDETNTDLIELLRWTQQQELKLLEQLLSPTWQTI